MSSLAPLGGDDLEMIKYPPQDSESYVTGAPPFQRPVSLLCVFVCVCLLNRLCTYGRVHMHAPPHVCNIASVDGYKDFHPISLNLHH